MVKLKSIPNQGTRTIHLPFVGDTNFENGYCEIDEEKAGELLKSSFGFKLTAKDSPDQNEDLGEAGKQNEAGDENEDSDPNALTLDALNKLRVKDLQEYFDDFNEKGLIDEETEKTYKVLAKPEKARFIFDTLQLIAANASETEENPETPETEEVK